MGDKKALVHITVTCLSLVWPAKTLVYSVFAGSRQHHCQCIAFSQCNHQEQKAQHPAVTICYAAF